MPIFAIIGNDAIKRNLKKPINNANLINLLERKVT